MSGLVPGVERYDIQVRSAYSEAHMALCKVHIPAYSWQAARLEAHSIPHVLRGPYVGLRNL